MGRLHLHGSIADKPMKVHLEDGFDESYDFVKDYYETTRPSVDKSEQKAMANIDKDHKRQGDLGMVISSDGSHSYSKAVIAQAQPYLQRIRYNLALGYPGDNRAVMFDVENELDNDAKDYVYEHLEKNRDNFLKKREQDANALYYGYDVDDPARLLGLEFW